MRLFSLTLWVALLVAARSVSAQNPDLKREGSLPRAEPNDQRQSAGRFVNGVLRVELEAVEAVWQPRGPEGPMIVTLAFAEIGAPPSVPGPLIRAALGTPVHVTVRNTLDRPIAVRGLLDRATADLGHPDSAPARDADFFYSAPLLIPSGAIGTAQFTPTAEVTSFYYGRIDYPQQAGDPFVPGGSGDEGAFLGALVVDGEGGPSEDERLFVITRWGGREEPSTLAVTFKMMINGLSWPYTERLHYAVGDTVHWRLLNASRQPHPMHLHGFYFTVDGRGDTDADTVYSAGVRPRVVTDVMPDFSSLRLTWVPERPGNWLFHCHLIRHMGALQRFAVEGEPRPHVMDAHSDPMEMDGMAGLVLGLHVDGDAPEDAPPARTLHLWTSATPGVFGDLPALSFVATDRVVPPMDTTVVPGSPLVLTQGEPTEIVVHNRYDFPISVHWHGLEVRSLYDGVAHWSGTPGMTRPPLASGGTARVLIEPPRAGTFIYHIHGEVGHELTQGLYGPFLVLPPGEAWDPERDRVFVLAARGAERDARPVINGDATPRPERFTPGEAVRLRFIHISPDAAKYVRLLHDGEPVTWQPLAKDGADLPAPHRSLQPAEVGIGVGETYDFSWTPEREGVYVLEVETEHYSASGLSPSLQRGAVGVGDVSEDLLAEAAHIEVAKIERDTTATVALSEAALRRFVGTYEGEGVPVTFTVQMNEEGLVLTLTGGEPGRLMPLGETLFRWEDPSALRAGQPFARIAFEERGDGMVLKVFGTELTRPLD